jgi:hypothetical protein
MLIMELLHFMTFNGVKMISLNSSQGKDCLYKRIGSQKKRFINSNIVIKSIKKSHN